MPQGGEETQEVELSVFGVKVIHFQHKGFREPGLMLGCGCVSYHVYCVGHSFNAVLSIISPGLQSIMLKRYPCPSSPMLI